MVERLRGCWDRGRPARLLVCESKSGRDARGPSNVLPRLLACERKSGRDARGPRHAPAPQKNRAPFSGLGKAWTGLVGADVLYFACALRAAMSASLRSVITPILLSRKIGTVT